MKFLMVKQMFRTCLTSKILLAVFFIFSLVIFNESAVFAVTVKDILRKMDQLQKLEEDVTAKVNIVQQDVEQGKKVMQSIYFAKDTSDLFLIVLTAPESEKGNGYLKIAKNFWMYRRNTRTFQHVSRDESIAGSDANASDFEAPKYEKHYKAILAPNGSEIIESTMLGKVPVYKVEIISQIVEVDYPKKILWVRKDNFLPLKEQSFSLSGTLMKTQYFLKYSQVDHKYIPVKQLVIDEFEKGNKTLWEITDISFKPIAESVFTKAYLENLSK